MLSRKISIAVISLVWVREAAAEGGRFNLSIEPAVPVDVSTEQGPTNGSGVGFHFDWAFSRWLALQGHYQGSLFTSIDPDTLETINDLNAVFTAGVRIRPPFLNDDEGYKIHVGNKKGHEGNLWGNFWLDFGVGFSSQALSFASQDLTGRMEAGIGYELSLFDGVLVGPFARVHSPLLPPLEATRGLAAEDAILATFGISINLALPSRSVHGRDSDDDGLIDAEEANRGTNPNDADSDNDGIKDGVEILGSNPTNALSKDSDNDTLIDGHEDFNANGQLDPGETDPTRPDTDTGGLNDGQEELDLSNPLDVRDDDKDGDGVPDKDDVCDATPKRLAVNAKGCAIFDRDLVLEGNLFTKDKSVLMSSSYTALQRIAVILKDNPGIKVEIGAHDPSVKGKKGLSLTQARADAIREYLISVGVPAEQMSAKGYANVAPVSDPKLAKTKSNRVEIRRVNDKGELIAPYPTTKK